MLVSESHLESKGQEMAELVSRQQSKGTIVGLGTTCPFPPRFLKVKKCMRIFYGADVGHSRKMCRVILGPSKRKIWWEKRLQPREAEDIVRFLGAKEKQRTKQKRDAFDPIKRTAVYR